MKRERALPLRIDIPAKINLWLEVIRKRSDGYHELSSLMLPVGIYDQVDLELTEEEGIRLACASPGVPSDSGNLAWRAASLFIEEAGYTKGVSVRLDKSIPVGAGMGGGSADAGAVLTGLNRLLPGCVSEYRLHEMAVKLGADVPFFLYCRPALATGIGDCLQPVEGVPRYPLVLIKPPLSVSTRRVYLSLKLTRMESRIKLPSFLARPWDLQNLIENDLESVTLAEYPLLSRIKLWMKEQGALESLMSGSGPTVFGVFRDRSLADGVAALAKRKWRDCWIAATEVLGA